MRAASIVPLIRHAPLVNLLIFNAFETRAKKKWKKSLSRISKDKKIWSKEPRNCFPQVGTKPKTCGSPVVESCFCRTSDSCLLGRSLRLPAVYNNACSNVCIYISPRAVSKAPPSSCFVRKVYGYKVQLATHEGYCSSWHLQV